MHDLIYTRTARKDIRKLDIVTQKRLKKSLEKFREDPLSKSVKLTDSKLNVYRFRVGNYRAIFQIRGTNIEILRVQHRREIYRNL